MCCDRYRQLEISLHRVECKENISCVPDHREPFCRRRQGGHASSHVSDQLNWPVISGGGCFTDTPHRHCSSCALDRLPLTSRHAAWFPRYSTGYQSLCLPSYSILEYFNFQTYPFPKDAAADRLLHLSSGLHCSLLSNPNLGQVTVCRNFVSSPCKSSQRSHSKMSTSVAVV